MPINSSGPDWVTVIPRRMKGKKNELEDLLFFLLNGLRLCGFTNVTKTSFLLLICYGYFWAQLEIVKELSN